MRLADIPNQRQSILFQLVTAVVGAAAALGVNALFLELTDVGSLPLFLAAVVLCAWYGGTLSALLCLLLTFPMVILITSPRWELSLDSGDDWIRIGLISAVGIMIIALDMLRRGAARLEHESQEALLENEERLRLALAAGRMGTFEWDIASQRIRWDTNIEALRGAGAEGEFQGPVSEFLEMVHPDDRQRLQLTVTRTLQAGAEFLDMEYRAFATSGEVLWFSVKGHVIRSGAGVPIGISGVAWDTTERKQAEQALVASEEHTRLILDSALDAIVTMDAQGIVTAWNPQAEAVFGWTAEEAVGRILAELIVPEAHRDAHRLGLEQFLVTGEGSVLNNRIEMTALHRDGHEFPVELSVVPVRSGKEYTFSAFIRDITKRKAAEDALRESEERFRTMADTAPVMIWVADETNMGTWFNRPWLEFTGRTLDDELGVGWTQAIHPDDMERCVATCQTAFDKREEFRMEFRLRRRDGEYRWVLDHGVPRHGPGNEFAGYIGSCIDVHERKESEARDRFLSETSAILASSLDYEQTLNALVDTIVPRIADFCVVDLTRADGSLDRVAVAAADPEKERLLIELPARYPRRETMRPIQESISEGKSILYREIDQAALAQMAQDEDHARIQKELDTRSTIVVPLMAHGQAIGVLTMNMSESGRRFGDEDLITAESLAERAAYAIENARLFGESQRARQRQEFLVYAGGVLASSLDYRATLDHVVRLAVPEVADSCVLDLIGPDGTPRGVAFLHRDNSKQGLLDELSRYSPYESNDHPVLEVLRTGEPRLIDPIDPGRLEQLPQDARHAELLAALRPASALFVPLQAHGQFTGVMTVAMTAEHGRSFTPEAVLTIRGLAQRAALAIESSRLYAVSQENREREHALASASAILSSSLDYEETVDRVARLMVPNIADYCMVDVVQPDGSLRRLANAHANADKEAVLWEVMQRYPPGPKKDNPALMALREKRTFHIEQFSAATEQAIAVDEDHLRMLRLLGPRSALCVPMIVQGQPIGILTIVQSDSGRSFSPEDISLTEQLASRGALAIENARLYRESREIQEQLRKANMAKDEFLGMVSHELRTPVTTMYSGAKLLLSRYDELDDEVIRDVIRDVENESERLQLIIENLLALARQDMGYMIQPEPVAVKRTVAAAAHRLEKSRPDRAVKIECCGEPHYVSCVPIYLDLVLRNVMDNADKYSPPSEPIEVTTENENGRVQIRVRDYGPGIPAEDAEKIFDRFYRSAQTAKSTSGAGIGLAVCRRLIESQGGTIQSRNASGGGLEVVLQLPKYEEN